MPAWNGTNSFSSTSFFFLPIARRSSSAPAEGVAGHPLGDLLHLLLVDDQAVGEVEDVGERLGQLGVDRDHRLPAGLAQRVVGVAVGAHRAGTVQREGAEMSSNLSGCMVFSSTRMPPPSSWKMPRVSPVASSS